jgi:hypothetical protein
VQPDIAVFCNEALLDERGALGKPDYYRLGESLHSDVLGGAEIPLGSFIPEPKKAKKKAKKSGKILPQA